MLLVLAKCLTEIPAITTPSELRQVASRARALRPPMHLTSRWLPEDFKKAFNELVDETKAIREAALRLMKDTAEGDVHNLGARRASGELAARVRVLLEQ